MKYMYMYMYMYIHTHGLHIKSQYLYSVQTYTQKQ